MANQPPTWTDDEVHTAMCLWEAYEDLQMNSDDEELKQLLTTIRDGHGTCSLRLLLIDLVKDCDLAWEAYEALNGDGIAFDWEFVPEFLAQQVREGRIAHDAEYQWKILTAA